MHKPILFADNDPDFLNSWAENLEAAGYSVIKAGSPEEAVALMKQKYVHLAIIDLRLRNDKDPNDRSGYEVLQNEDLEPIKKIVLTGHATLEDARTALKPRSNKEPLAVDLIGKEDGIKKVISTVDDAMNTRIDVDWNLKLSYDSGSFLSLPGLAMMLERNLPIEALTERVGETEALFRKVFKNHGQVQFSRLLWQRQGICALHVLTRSEGGETSLVLTYSLRSVRCGTPRMEPNALTNLPGVGSTVVKKSGSTLHYHAETAELAGADMDSLQNFPKYFRENSDRQLLGVLEKLAGVTLSALSQQGRTIKNGDELLRFYRDWAGLSETCLPQAEFKARLLFLAREAHRHEKIEIELDDVHLVVKFPNGAGSTYPSPMRYLYNESPFSMANHVFASSLGGLDLKTLAVSPANSRAWLTDFTRLMEAPLSFEIAAIETAIHFDLENDIFLQDVLDDEKEILKNSRFSSTIRYKDLSSGSQRKGEMINTLRQNALDWVGEDLPTYILGLIFCTAKRLATYDPYQILKKSQRLKSLYQLVYCGMLCQKLDQLAHPARTDIEAPALLPPLTLEEIDEKHGVVRIGEHVARLSETEYRFFHYLYQNAGKICKKEDIMYILMGGNIIKGDTNYVNTLLMRVRDEIEPNPRRPKYILTIQREGIRLVLQPDNLDLKEK
jgi:DNA-binding response OmpR family regulator